MISGVELSSMAQTPPRRSARWLLQPNLAEIDAGPELRLDRLRAAALGRDLDDIFARPLVQLVEFEVAVIVAGALGDRPAILGEPHARPFDAVDRAARFRGERAGDEAFRVAPEVAIVDPRLGAGLRLHHLEALLTCHARHLGILDLDRAHRSGRTGLLAARLLPALVEQVGVERPMLRQLQLLVPPDVPVGTGFDQVLLPLGLDRVDDDDAVVALADGTDLVGLHARRVVAVVAHGRNVGDVDDRQLPPLLLQNVDPLVAMPRHRRGVARPAVVDIFVHGRERAEVAVGALGDVDDHVPFLHWCSERMANGEWRIANRVCPFIVRRSCRYSLLPIRYSLLATRSTHFAGTSAAALSVSRTCRSCSMRAKVSDMCSIRPSHNSTCTNDWAPASEWVVLVCVWCGVSWLRQPPRSTDFPGSPIGS